MKAFIKILEDNGVNVTVRRKLGGDVDASCRVSCAEKFRRARNANEQFRCYR